MESDSYLRVRYYDNFRVYHGGQAAAARWNIRVDNAFTGHYLDVSVAAAGPGSGGNHNRPATLTGYITGVDSGDHVLDIWATAISSGGPQMYTGFDETLFLIEVQEIPFGMVEVAP